MKEIIFKTDNSTGIFDPTELKMGKIVVIKKDFVLTN